MTLPLRVAVCDDELMARRRVLRLLETIGGVEAAFECPSADALLALLGREDVDVVLLDVDMPGRTGLDAALALPEDRPAIVFVTAHPEHAVRAFDVGATDYVLKPVEEGRLATALDRVRRDLAPPPADGEAPSGERLPVKTRDGIVLVSPGDLTHASFDGALVTLHVAPRRGTTVSRLLTDTSLGELEGRLGPEFARVHRRALLHLARVARLVDQPSGGYLARTDRGDDVVVSRQAARRLRRRLGRR